MRVLILSADRFEDEELRQPLEALRKAGVDVDIASTETGPIRGKHGMEVEAQRSVGETDAADYDMLLLPGGKAPAKLRDDVEVLELVRGFDRRELPIAAICHGPQILISAGLMEGRKATAYRAVAAELKEAGAQYLDEAVVIDGRLLTSREPGDLTAFISAIKEMLGISS